MNDDPRGRSHCGLKFRLVAAADSGDRCNEALSETSSVFQWTLARFSADDISAEGRLHDATMRLTEICLFGIFPPCVQSPVSTRPFEVFISRVASL